MRAGTFSSGLRLAAAALWGVGAAIAATTGMLAAAHSMAGYGVLYAVVATALGVLTVALHRGHRWAEVITFCLLGGQVLGMGGAAWELAYGADDTAKAGHLQDLGVHYRWALAANLAYSALASVLFVWTVGRMVRSRRRGG